MTEIDEAAKTYTERIQEVLPGAVVRLRKVNSGQALKVSVVFDGRAVAELIGLPTVAEFVFEAVERLALLLVPRRSSWDRLLDETELC